MTGLVLKLGPNERVLINGAVIENGNRRSRLNIMTPGANILRLRDAIHPEQTGTPVRRLCYIAQLVLSGDTDLDTARPQLLKGIDQVAQALLDPVSQVALSDARRAAEDGQAYYVLKSLRKLLPTEDVLLKGVSQ
ncbi:flagellar biosynthesis repressor FlbT [Maribius pontilimi]|uniref:Flagellar biosynthesis repressor FlbT n=1 Tax=Palleronia pontilimi TaxID=1964209 RepID=A0A934ME79_9RHOB|nr:flagellar biosynthesis repressor FlbT [Palleronia pontilimi]MBJ3763171.1 flagellar biosynthesis repressor FlbT [Palleronia pontilimi]